MNRATLEQLVIFPLLQSSLLQRLAIALMFAIGVTFTWTEPSQAGLLSIFSRNTGGRPNGRSRGGATRDSVCSPTAAANRTTDKFPELVALVPNSLQKTSRAKPEFLVYVPFNRQEHSELELTFELARKPTPAARQPLLAPQPVPLPEQAGLIPFPLPAEISLEENTVYEWSFRLSCRGNSLAAAASQGQPVIAPIPPTTSPSSLGTIDIAQITIPGLAPVPARQTQTAYGRSTVRQEIYGEIKRVSAPQASQRLAAALTQTSPEKRLQAYQEIDLWFDLVSILSNRRSTSADWQTLLDEFAVEP